MTVSVRMDPLLEKELEQAARRQGITKSQFIIDAVQRALGRKDPAAIYRRVMEQAAHYRIGEGVGPSTSSEEAEASGGHSTRLRENCARSTKPNPAIGWLTRRLAKWGLPGYPMTRMPRSEHRLA